MKESIILAIVWKNGGRSQIRTDEGVSQQIYSLPPLATWVSYHQLWKGISRIREGLRIFAGENAVGGFTPKTGGCQFTEKAQNKFPYWAGAN
jgi:hypothetical protein